MKILHTADWHMNSTLGRQNLSGDIVAALEQIALYLDEHGVDVLLVAGDLFSERSRDEGMLEAIGQIHRIFGPFVARGGTILAVAGNHDSELKFETLRRALMLGSGDALGRFVVTADPQVVSVEDAAGQRVQFVLMPYPTARCYLRGENVAYETLEAKNRLVQERFSATLNHIQAHQMQPGVPAVLVSHIHVRGASSHSLYQVGESDDVVFEPEQLRASWAYAAYGHIHKPGPAVAGLKHVRYSGSPIMLDAAERYDSKGCVLFEIKNDELVGDIRVLPLSGPKIHQVVVDITERSLDEALADLKPHIAPTDLVSYTLRFNPAHDSNLTAVKGAIERELGRVYARNEERVGTDVGEAPLILSKPESGAPVDVPVVVREYLTRNLSAHEDKEALLNLAEELLARQVH